MGSSSDDVARFFKIFMTQFTSSANWRFNDSHVLGLVGLNEGTSTRRGGNPRLELRPWGCLATNHVVSTGGGGPSERPPQRLPVGEQEPPPLPFLPGALPPASPPRPVPSLLFPPRKLSAGWSIAVSGRSAVRADLGGRGGPARVYAATGGTPRPPGSGCETLTGERAGPGGAEGGGGEPEHCLALPYTGPRLGGPLEGAERVRALCRSRDGGASVRDQGLPLAEPRSAFKRGSRSPRGGGAARGASAPGSGGGPDLADFAS